MSALITFENVYYSYSHEEPCEKWALENINLSIEQGEFIALAGENGSGRTTFCRLINGIIPHLCGGRLLGNVIVDGDNTKEVTVPHLALKAGIVLDDPDAQLFTSTVRHEAAFGPENLLLPPAEIEERVNAALSAVGLCGFEDRLVATLSGGEKQRLAIACALAMSFATRSNAGKILVLDEPLARLDPQGAEQVMSVLADIRSKYQLTVIMAAGSGREAALADRVCVLKNGRLIAYDTTQTILSNQALLDENGIQLPGEIDILSAFPIKDEESQAPQPQSAIDIVDLHCSYGSKVCIEGLNLSIKDNDFLAIIGHNGCGKTTLLKSITGLLRPAHGDIFIRGQNTKDLAVSDISKEAGFVMQNPSSQLFTDSVYNEVSFALKKNGLSKAQIHEQVLEALRVVGLETPEAFPHTLSRADRTKTVLASVLAMGCKILILDEVDVGQDYRGSRRLMNIAKELHSRGYTIIFVTHNMSLACEYAHRLIMMEKGRVIHGRRKNIPH